MHIMRFGEEGAVQLFKKNIAIEALVLSPAEGIKWWLGADSRQRCKVEAWHEL